jgi:hypothetical protein
MTANIVFNSVIKGVHRMNDFITTALILVVVALTFSRFNKGSGMG